MRAPIFPHDLKSFFARVPPAQRELVDALRRLVRWVVPETEETVLWGSLSYHRPALGGRVKGAVCLITPKRDRVDLGFIHGAALEDPARLLRGSGKHKRHVSIRHVDEIDEEALRCLLEAALHYHPSDSPEAL